MLSLNRFPVLAGLSLGLVLMICMAVEGADVDFSGLPEGFVLEGYPLSTGDGISGPLNGVVVVTGFPGPAIVFDSDCPPTGTPADCSGNDDDLGTPNETCVAGAPGTDKDVLDGTGGECLGPPFSDYPNLVAYGNIAIVAENTRDRNGDGLIDDPDDADVAGEYIEFDFTGVSGKGVFLSCFTYLDNDQGEDNAMAFFWTHGENRNQPPINSFGLDALGDNGVLTICPGIDEVEYMQILLDGSGAVTSVLIEEEVPTDCWVTLGGFNKQSGTIGDSSGKKTCTFGGNVGPPPSGSFEVNWHDGDLAGSRFHTNDMVKVRCEDLTDGPGQPGGKKGFVQDTLFFECDEGKFDGESGYTCDGYFQDNKEPQGKKSNDPDALCINVYDDSGAVVATCGIGCNPANADPDAGGGYEDSPLIGGNVQIHPCNGNQCLPK